MSTFDEAVRHDLAGARPPASLDHIRRLARRRRSRKMMSGAVALVLVAIGAGLLIDPNHHSGTVAVQPSTPRTSTPSPSSTGTVNARADSVLAIGDSVMKGSTSALQHAIGGITVDAAIGRRFDQALSVVDEHKRLGPLPSTIVIHLGEVDAALGQPPVASTLDNMMNAIGSQSFVYLLTVHIPRTSESAVNDALRGLASRRPNVRVLDWQTFAQPHTEWFVQDGFHLVAAGQAAYAAFIRNGIDAEVRCPGAPVTLPTGGQTVVPVSVPCDCPTTPITAPPSGADDATDAARAAIAWVSRVKHWAPKSGRVTAIYKVGDTSRGVWGIVFAQSVPEFCGRAVTTASWGIELGNDHIHDTGRQAAVVVAHFATGWQVWGVYT